MRIEESQGNIVALSDIREKKLRASSPYGPVRAGLITWQGRETVTEDQLAQLSELLNSLESVVENLNSKSSTLCDTLSTAIQGVSAVLNATPIESAGIDETP
jgi:hypothetical protein